MEHGYGAIRFVCRHLHRQTELFVEQDRKGILDIAGQIDLEPAVSGECHLEKRREKTAITAVVARGDRSLPEQALCHLEGPLELRRIPEVRRIVSDLSEYVGQCRAAEPDEAVREIYVQDATGFRQLQIGSDDLRHIGARHVGGHDE